MNLKLLKLRPLNIPVWLWLLILIALLTSYMLNTFHLDDRFYYWIKTQQHKEKWQEHAVWLPDYQVNIDARQISGIKENLSGLTYDPDHKQLWAVTNNPEELFVLTTEGEVKRRYRLKGFQDVEAVAYIRANTLVIAEERLQTLTVIKLPPQQDVHVLNKKDFNGLTLNMGPTENKGIEGLNYDLKGDRLFITKERDPMQIIELRDFQQNLSSGLLPKIHNHTLMVEANLFSTDLSSVAIDQKSGHLVLLSDESKLLIEMTDQGEVISFRSLSKGFAGLEDAVKQAEGVALDEDGNLYVVGEPNLFYRFSRTKN